MRDRRSYVARLLPLCALVLALSFVGCGSSSSGGGSSSIYIPTWIAASWSGGAKGPPTDRRDEEAEEWTGSICPASSLILENYTDEFAGLHLINRCTQTISYAACVSKGSLPQPQYGLEECATDPFETPMADLTFKALDPGEYGDFINTTENLSLNIFFCSDDQTLCAAPICDSVQCL